MIDKKVVDTEQLANFLMETDKRYAAKSEAKERYVVGEEVLIGEWVEGGVTYDLFRKVVDCGEMPNSGSKTVPHGITNFHRIVHVFGSINKSDNSNTLPLPFAATSANYNIYIAVGKSNITLQPGSDRTGYLATVVIEFARVRS